jgi:hypothetical protein
MKVNFLMRPAFWHSSCCREWPLLQWWPWPAVAGQLGLAWAQGPQALRFVAAGFLGPSPATAAVAQLLSQLLLLELMSLQLLLMLMFQLLELLLKLLLQQLLLLMLLLAWTCSPRLLEAVLWGWAGQACCFRGWPGL